MKNTVQTIQKHSKYKYTYYHNTLTLQNKLQQPQYKILTKLNSHSTIKYSQYKVTPLYMELLSPPVTNKEVALPLEVKPRLSRFGSVVYWPPEK
jgi:hypothetical protein